MLKIKYYSVTGLRLFIWDNSLRLPWNEIDNRLYINIILHHSEYLYTTKFDDLDLVLELSPVAIAL